MPPGFWKVGSIVAWIFTVGLALSAVLCVILAIFADSTQITIERLILALFVALAALGMHWFARHWRQLSQRPPDDSR